MPIAMLGDSDSHSFHDRIWMPQGRGGTYAAGTYQWVEILLSLRGRHLDAGPWGIHGTRKTVARLLEAVGIPSRAPRKEDFRNNFAVSGARGGDLNEGIFRQAPRLITLMNREPERWRKGIVVIRIGVNPIGFQDSLDGFAADPVAPVARAQVQACLSHIRAAVSSIQQAHPDTRFVLVGILNNADWPPNFGHWQSARGIARIDAGLDGYDDVLRQWAATDPRLAFFDDREWFRQRWGRRGPDGQPDRYATVAVGDFLRVSLSQGDEPTHAVLMDGHAGLVWNALWAQSLVQLLRSAFQVPVPAIQNAELVEFITRACHRGSKPAEGPNK